MADSRARTPVKIVDPTTGGNEVAVSATGGLRINLNEYLGSAVGAANAVHVQPGTGASFDVNSELPAAAALADNTANPTVPGVGGFLMGFDGTNWDRIRADGGSVFIQDGGNSITVDGSVSISGSVDTELAAAASLADNTANPSVTSVGTFPHWFDGTTWDRAPGNSAGGVYVQGNVASDVAVTANPLLAGARASTAVPTAVSADGDAVALWANLNGALKTVMVDDAGDSAMDGTNNALRVNVVAGSTAGVTHTDDAAFTPASDDGVPMFAFADETGTDTVDEGDAGVVRMDTSRRLLVRIVGATDANRMDIDASGRPTVNVNGTVTVDSELSAAASLADNTANPTVTSVGTFPHWYDGSTWDRALGNSTDGLLVNLGGNNDVTVTSGSITADTELPAAAALADATANPTVPAVGAFLMGYNGSTWDRVDTANTGRLQVDVVTGGGSDTPTNPVISYQTSASLAAGASVALTTAEAGSKKLAKVDVWASLPFKATLTTVDNGSESTVKAIGGGQAAQPWQWSPRHRNYITLGATAGLDAFRVNVTNLDNNSACDVYAVFEYED